MLLPHKILHSSAGEFLLGLAVMIPDRFTEFLKKQLSRKVGAEMYVHIH